MASTANVDLRFTSKKSSRNYSEDEVGDTVRGSKSQEVEVEIAKKHISGNRKKSFCTSKANRFVRRVIQVYCVFRFVILFGILFLQVD
ncbi:hypothetical protein HanHA300_Chr17g0664461 [Helianthus annuus]|nr:hypothetical protein HanHA300_Chr17g0664461 [Helianthus annuus]